MTSPPPAESPGDPRLVPVVKSLFAGRVPEATDAVGRLGAFLREHLAG